MFSLTGGGALTHVTSLYGVTAVPLFADPTSYVRAVPTRTKKGALLVGGSHPAPPPACFTSLHSALLSWALTFALLHTPSLLKSPALVLFF